MPASAPWSSEKTISNLSREPIGLELAEAVASKLISERGRGGIWYTHRDYCGHALVYLYEKICVVEYDDGMPFEGTILKRWKSESEFVGWLRNQSDYSLSGADEREADLYTDNRYRQNNQRITARRLRRFLAGESNP